MRETPIFSDFWVFFDILGCAFYKVVSWNVGCKSVWCKCECVRCVYFVCSWELLCKRGLCKCEFG